MVGRPGRLVVGRPLIKFGFGLSKFLKTYLGENQFLILLINFLKKKIKPCLEFSDVGRTGGAIVVGRPVSRFGSVVVVVVVEVEVDVVVVEVVEVIVEDVVVVVVVVEVVFIVVVVIFLVVVTRVNRVVVLLERCLIIPNLCETLTLELVKRAAFLCIAQASHREIW